LGTEKEQVTLLSPFSTSMPAEHAMAAPVALFLFAHQDDEFGVFQQIVAEKMRGHRVICVYFTSGVPRGKDPGLRNQESLSVLSSLGVHRDDVFFAGSLLSIDDIHLYEHLQIASEWLDSWLGRRPLVVSVYVTAWEGGHPDHDVLHAIVVQIFHEREMGRQVRQFSLYNGYRCSGSFYRVLFPLCGNGPVERTMIPWTNRFRFLGYCLRYPSQLKTWIGLLPFIVLHYLFHGGQTLQPVSISRTRERPHDGHLYYEQRGFSSWQMIESRLSHWREARTLNSLGIVTSPDR
jgi:LmbE family N-acetylglucosaminyl deacetylase